MCMFCGRVLLVICGVIASVSGSPGAYADGREEVHIRRGVELRRKGKDQEALMNFQKAYEVGHTARAAAQLGLCEQALAQWLQAHIHLSDALATESDVWVSKHRVVLEKAKSDVEDKLGRVEVKGGPIGALVVVAGEVLGRLPEVQSTHVLPGLVDITVTADRHERLEETRTVTAGQVVRLEVTLKPAPLAKAAPPSTALSTQLRKDNAADLTASGSAANEVKPTQGLGSSKVLAWSALGAGAVLVGAGVVFGVRTSSLAEEARTSEFYDPAKEDSAKSSRTLSFVFLGAGVAGLCCGEHQEVSSRHMCCRRL